MEKQQLFSKKAVSFFNEGFNCAESVLMAMQDFFDFEMNPKIATGFGAGIGRKGSVCGAVSGAILAVNLKYGRREAEENNIKEEAYSRALEFYNKFEEKMGSAICYDIIKCDLTTEGGQKIFMENNLHEERCIKCVETSIDILLAMFEEGD
jgi:C_GCAxxG_C_C family probable redox protein